MRRDRPLAVFTAGALLVLLAAGPTAGADPRSPGSRPVGERVDRLDPAERPSALIPPVVPGG